MQPKQILINLLGLVYHNSLLTTRIDLDATINDTLTYLLSIKGDKQEFTKVMDILKRVNSSSVPFSKEKLLSELTSESGDFTTWDNCHIFETTPTEIPDITKLVLSEEADLKEQLLKPSIVAALGKAFSELKFNSLQIKNPNDYLSTLIGTLEGLMKGNTAADAAVLEEVSLDKVNPTEVSDVFNNIKQSGEAGGRYKLGWKALNIALQGGPRPGDFMMVGSLEHNYKSGVARSIFRQIAKYNNPPEYAANEAKKPLLWFVSFEDPLTTHIQFIFQNIMFNRTRQKVDMSKFTSEQIQTTVINELQANGWTVRFSRVDPSTWTYRKFIEKVLAVEGAGYDLKVMVADYVLKIPTVGCDRSGATGTDLRDMIMRLRNFFAAKKILIVTPGQLAPAVKDEQMKGTADVNLLSWIAEKGLYAGSKQISQELDISLLIKKVRSQTTGLTYLDMLVEKHRAPQAIEDNLKHFGLVFPPDGMPIPDDVDEPGNGSHVKSIPV